MYSSSREHISARLVRAFLLHMAQTGRPPKYDTPEQMQEAIDLYFADCGNNLPEIAEMAYYLGFENRSGLDYYMHEKPGFSRTIKRAKLKVESEWAKQLARPSSVTGVIFNLKNNFGWKDAQELNHTGADGVPLALKVEFVGSYDTDT